ncbi:MAG: hypothetical protein ABI865_02650, partial [Nitrosospira sp.]
PDNVNFGGDFGGGFAKILASKDEVQPVIDHFKQWLSMAHTLYVKRSKKSLNKMRASKGKNYNGRLNKSKKGLKLCGVSSIDYHLKKSTAQPDQLLAITALKT